MNMKRILALVMLLVALPVLAMAAPTDATVDVTTAAELAGYAAQTRENPVVYRNLTINIKNDIDMSNTSWTPFYLNGYHGAKTYTINGNNHKITGLTSSLFEGTWAGAGKLYIKDLTIADSKMNGGADNKGFGAFVGHTEATTVVQIENCHLVNSEVKGEDWTGGFVGYAAGYNVRTDGPVFETVTIKNSSVKNSTIVGKGSTGAIIGHATGNVWTQVNILNCVVEDNTITCTDDSNVKAGSVLGTVGAAGKENNDKTGGVSVDATVKNNVVKSNGKANNRIFGRFGSDNGVLTIAGGIYYDCMRAECVQPDGDSAKNTELIIDNSAKFADEFVVVENGKAEVDDAAVDKALEEAKNSKDEIVTIEATSGNDKEQVEEVELPAAALEEVKEAGKGVEIQLGSGSEEKTSVTIDNTALATALSAAANTPNAKVEVSVKKVEATSALNSKQVAAMEKAGKTAVVITATMKVNNEPISKFNGGKVDIKIPFEIEPGMKANMLKLIYVDDNGKTEIIGNARFENGYIYATLSHFSDFVVVETYETVSGLPQTGDNSSMMLWMGLLMISACAFVMGKKVRA